jgi:hypothetical protein
MIFWNMSSWVLSVCRRTRFGPTPVLMQRTLMPPRSTCSMGILGAQTNVSGRFGQTAGLRRCRRIRPTQRGMSGRQSVSRTCSWRYPPADLAATPSCCTPTGVGACHSPKFRSGNRNSRVKESDHHPIRCSRSLEHLSLLCSIRGAGWGPLSASSAQHYPETTATTSAAARECLSWHTSCHRSGRSQHYQTEMGSPRDRFGATVGIELGEDRRDMELGRVERDS